MLILNSSVNTPHQTEDGQIDGQRDAANQKDHKEHEGGLQDGENALDAARDDFVVVTGNVLEGLVEFPGGLARSHHAQEQGGEDRMPVDRFADGAAGADVVADLGDGLLDEGVADEALLAHAERFEDGDAGAVKDGQVAREAGQGEHQVQLAEDGHAQFHAVEGLGKGEGLAAEDRHADHEEEQHRQPNPPAPLHDVARRQDDTRDQRLLDIELVQQRGKLGDDGAEEEQDKPRHHGDDNGGIERGLADLGHDALDPLKVVLEVVEGLRQLAAQLAGPDDAYEVVGEHVRVALERLMEAEAGFDVALQAGEDLLEGGVLAILAGDLDGLAQGDAGLHLESHQGAKVNQFPPPLFVAQAQPAHLRFRGR